MNAVPDMLTGGIAVGSFIAGLFFLRFWRETRDPFFLCFALSFWLEAGNRVALGMANSRGENEPAFYLVRLLSYGLILFAVWLKNKPRS